MGLLGLASFMTEQRTREIGIRKILGAEIRSIIGLLSKDFLILILISIAFAWVLTYWLITDWLQQFASRTEISYLLFMIAGLIALLITFVITSYKAIAVSKINPVDTLKYE